MEFLINTIEECLQICLIVYGLSQILEHDTIKEDSDDTFFRHQNY